MTSEELANKELEKLKESHKLTFPIDPFKILRDAGVFVVLKDFENLAGIIINDAENCTIVGINFNNNWQRQRFTAAHEYCHFIKDIKKEAIKRRKRPQKMREKERRDNVTILLPHLCFKVAP